MELVLDKAAPDEGVGAPKSGLELRLEISKRAANIREEIFKRFFSRLDDDLPGKIFYPDLYRNGCDEFHLHFDSIRPFCVTFRADVGLERGLKGDVDEFGRGREPDANELHMLVWVRDFSQRLRPCNSVIRLQALDCCEMVGAQSFEPGRFVPREFIWSVVNRKLGVLLDGPGIVPGEFIDKVIEGGSQIITNFTDQNTNQRQRTPAERELIVSTGIIRGIRIYIDIDRIKVALPEGFDRSFQISKMFLCPIDPLKSAIERVDRHVKTSKLQVDHDGESICGVTELPWESTG